ncbi:MAG: hypothetical protein KatS3mg057_1116 [Herpetosiphonaceae bacterium]|nr:MAG: hypothetical protein KatS3mg057_1116 [Herpetosiphonaceae bacterium]
MPAFDDLLLEVATQVGCGPDHLVTVIEDIAATLRRNAYYVYRRPTSSGGERPQPPARRRTIPAFISPDDALAFAFYGQVREVPRVHPLTKQQLLLRLVKDTSLAAIIFLEQPVERLPLSQQPGAIRVTRQQILDALGIVAGT